MSSASIFRNNSTLSVKICAFSIIRSFVFLYMCYLFLHVDGWNDGDAGHECR